MLENVVSHELVDRVGRERKFSAATRIEVGDDIDARPWPRIKVDPPRAYIGSAPQMKTPRPLTDGRAAAAALLEP
jgi:hypothetical protein